MLIEAKHEGVAESDIEEDRIQNMLDFTPMLRSFSTVLLASVPNMATYRNHRGV